MRAPRGLNSVSFAGIPQANHPKGVRRFELRADFVSERGGCRFDVARQKMERHTIPGSVQNEGL